MGEDPAWEEVDMSKLRWMPTDEADRNEIKRMIQTEKDQRARIKDLEKELVARAMSEGIFRADTNARIDEIERQKADLCRQLRCALAREGGK